jgi:hypothetical protein
VLNMTFTSLLISKITVDTVHICVLQQGDCSKMPVQCKFKFIFYSTKGAMSKHSYSHCRFSALADPPGGVWWLVLALRGGSFELYKDPLVGREGSGLGGGENCGEPTKLLDVF